MFQIFRGDKVVLVKPFGKIQDVGNEYEVADFTNTTVILRDCKTKIAACAISVEVFYMLFDKIEGAKGKWTKWQTIQDGLGNIVASYRTNFKKVEVRIMVEDKIYITAKATCYKGDDFNMAFGIHLAYLRAVKKQCEFEKTKITVVDDKKMSELNKTIGDVTNNIEKMCKG